MGFLQKAVKAVGRNIGSIGKAAGIRTSGGGGGGRGFGGLSGAVIRAVRAAKPQQISGSAQAGTEGISKSVQDAADVQQRMGQALGKAFNKGGSVSSGRGDGIAVRGKTKCKMY